MQTPPGFDIRYSYVTDIIYLRRWLETPGMLHWFPMTTESEKEQAIQAWMSFCRCNSSITATINHVPCAIGTLFLMPYKKVRHHCPFKLIVDPSQFGRGIGTSLVKNLKHLAKSYFQLEMINIEVVEGNPLINLLKKADFYEITSQEGYFKENDLYLKRFLMECKL